MPVYDPYPMEDPRQAMGETSPWAGLPDCDECGAPAGRPCDRSCGSAAATGAGLAELDAAIEEAAEFDRQQYMAELYADALDACYREPDA